MARSILEGFEAKIPIICFCFCLPRFLGKTWENANEGSIFWCEKFDDGEKLREVSRRKGRKEFEREGGDAWGV